MSARQGVGGWLLVLVLLLLVWGPVSLGLTAANALPALPIRGTPLGVLIVARVLVTSFGIAAGMALGTYRGQAVSMAKAALVLAALMDLIVYLTPYFPSNRRPGDTPVFVAASLVYHGTWLVYLFRSERVKQTYHDF